MPLTILIADDSRTVQQAIALIAGQEYSLVAVYDHAGLTNAMQETSPDMVMVDHTLPGGDTRQWCQSFTTKVPLVVLGNAQTDTASWQEVGAFTVLKKPFLAQDFLACVKQAIEQKAKATLDAMQPAVPPINQLEIQAAIRAAVEKVVWEVVPAMAETMIKEEIERLMQKNP